MNESSVLAEHATQATPGIIENFEPRIPRLDLAISAVGFGSMLAALSLATRDELAHGAGTASALLSNVLIPWAIYVAGATFAISMLSLPYRLRFSAEGMTRLTLLEPRFVPWHAVRAAQVTVFRAYFGLELRVGRWRTVLIPLRGYGRPASLVDAVGAYLPVGIRDPGNLLPRLRDQEAGVAEARG